MSSELVGLRTGLAPRRSALALGAGVAGGGRAGVAGVLSAGRAGELLVRQRDRGADADPGGAGDGLPGDVPPFRPLLAAAAAVAGVRRHCRGRGGGAGVRSRAALSAQGEFLAAVGADQLGAGGAGGAAGAAAGQAGGAGAGALAAADGDRRRRAQRARDRGRLRCPQQPSGLPGAGVLGPRPGCGRADLAGRRARHPGAAAGRAGQGAAGLAGPAARGGGPGARPDAGPRGADREPVVLPR